MMQTLVHKTVACRTVTRGENMKEYCGSSESALGEETDSLVSSADVHLQTPSHDRGTAE